VEWLIKHAKAAIDELAQLPPVREGEFSSEQQQQQQPQPQPQQQQTSSASTFSAGLSEVLPTPSLISSSGTSYGNYESHGQPPMVSASPFVHSAVEGMEPLGPGGPPAYGQVSVDPNFARDGEGIFRSASDVAGGSSGRVESRAKARERARERAKEKQYTGRELERDPGIPGRGYAASSSAAGHLAAPQYANLPSQVSSALQHPFQAPFSALGNSQPGLRQAPYSYFPEAFSSPPFGGYPPPSYAHPEPSPSSFISVSQSQASVSQYFVENPPSAIGGRYPTGNTNPNFPGFSPGPPASSLRVSPFASFLSDPGYSGYPNQAGYPPSPYSSQPRPSSLLGQAPGSRLPHGTVYPPPSSHLVRPGHDRPVHSTPHSLDPNFYTPQIPSSLQGFEEIEEEFKP